MCVEDLCNCRHAQTCPTNLNCLLNLNLSLPLLALLLPLSPLSPPSLFHPLMVGMKLVNNYSGSNQHTMNVVCFIHKHFLFQIMSKKNKMPKPWNLSQQTSLMILNKLHNCVRNAFLSLLTIYSSSPCGHNERKNFTSIVQYVRQLEKCYIFTLMITNQSANLFMSYSFFSESIATNKTLTSCLLRQYKILWINVFASDRIYN